MTRAFLIVVLLSSASGCHRDRAGQTSQGTAIPVADFRPPTSQPAGELITLGPLVFRIPVTTLNACERVDGFLQFKLGELKVGLLGPGYIENTPIEHARSMNLPSEFTVDHVTLLAKLYGMSDTQLRACTSEPEAGEGLVRLRMVLCSTALKWAEVVRRDDLQGLLFVTNERNAHFTYYSSDDHWCGTIAFQMDQPNDASWETIRGIVASCTLSKERIAGSQPAVDVAATLSRLEELASTAHASRPADTQP